MCIRIHEKYESSIYPQDTQAFSIPQKIFFIFEFFIFFTTGFFFYSTVIVELL